MCNQGSCHSAFAANGRPVTSVSGMRGTLLLTLWQGGSYCVSVTEPEAAQRFPEIVPQSVVSKRTYLRALTH
jgi:hypothetical protein